MTPRPLLGIWVTVLVWISVVGGLWAREEYLSTHGHEILLPTLPVDPRDLFRGDYVTLRYEISRHQAPLYRQASFENGQTVYVLLKLDGQHWAIEKIVSQKPARGISLRGRISEVHKEKYQVTYGIQYGIESYFVPEGEGKKLESLREQKKLSAVINVTPEGQAKIKRLVTNH